MEVLISLIHIREIVKSQAKKAMEMSTWRITYLVSEVRLISLSGFENMRTYKWNIQKKKKDF